MPFPKVKSHELASCFNCEADLDGSWWFESMADAIGKVCTV
jgi:hypothetical protein